MAAYYVKEEGQKNMTESLRESNDLLRLENEILRMEVEHLNKRAEFCYKLYVELRTKNSN